MNITLFLGNGFNLYHGVKTKFCDFRQYLLAKPIAGDTTFATFQNILQGNTRSTDDPASPLWSEIDSWSSFEAALAYYHTMFKRSNAGQESYLRLVDWLRQALYEFLAGNEPNGTPQKIDEFCRRTELIGLIYDNQKSIPSRKERRKLRRNLQTINHTSFVASPSRPWWYRLFSIFLPSSGVLRNRLENARHIYQQKRLMGTLVQYRSPESWQQLDALLWKNRRRRWKVKFISFTHNNLADIYISGAIKYKKHLNPYATFKINPRVIYDKDVLYPYGQPNYLATKRSDQDWLVGISDYSEFTDIQNLTDRREVTKRLIKQELIWQSKPQSLSYCDTVDQIRRSNIICIWGMSMGCSDGNLWGEILNWLNISNHHHLIIIGNDEFDGLSQAERDHIFYELKERFIRSALGVNTQYTSNAAFSTVSKEDIEQELKDIGQQIHILWPGHPLVT